MKNSIKSFISLLLALVVAVAFVFGINSFLEKEEAAEGGSSNPFAATYPSAVNSEQIQVEGFDDVIENVYQVEDESGSKGYVFDAKGSGYGGEFTYQIGVDSEGIIQGFQVFDHNETQGFGAPFSEPEYAQSLVGTNIGTGALTYGAGNPDQGEIQAISGATVTTVAVVDTFTEVANALSTLEDSVQPVQREVPYYTEIWQDLFLNDLSIFNFEEFVDEDFYQDGIQRMIRVTNKEDGGFDSYLVQASGSGFAGPIDYIIRLDENYRVFNIAFGKMNETPDYGAYIGSKEYKDIIKGINLDANWITNATKLRKEPKHEKDILLISGATVTSRAMKDSLDQVIEDLERFNSVKNDDSKYQALDLDQLRAAESNTPSYDHSQFDGIGETSLIEGAGNDLVVAVSEAGDSYIYDVNTQGFAGTIEFGLLVDADGTIKDMVIYNHSETDGYGAGIEKKDYQDQILGQNLNDVKDFTDQVDAVSGSTITSNAMYEGLNAVRDTFLNQ